MKFLFVGDVMLGRLVNDILQERPPAYPWGDNLPIFRDADIRICNLECVISDRGTPWTITPKVFHFRSDARNVKTLKIAGINVVSLANNHALDYGYQALFDMLKILDNAGIHRAGAGINFDEACRPA
ncbi:partial putative polyglutamine synthesis accessory protein, partial [Anaerolineae bacterium]